MGHGSERWIVRKCCCAPDLTLSVHKFKAKPFLIVSEHHLRKGDWRERNRVGTLNEFSPQVCESACAN